MCAGGEGVLPGRVALGCRASLVRRCRMHMPLHCNDAGVCQLCPVPGAGYETHKQKRNSQKQKINREKRDPK